MNNNLVFNFQPEEPESTLTKEEYDKAVKFGKTWWRKIRLKSFVNAASTR